MLPQILAFRDIDISAFHHGNTLFAHPVSGCEGCPKTTAIFAIKLHFVIAYHAVPDQQFFQVLAFVRIHIELFDVCDDIDHFLWRIVAKHRGKAFVDIQIAVLHAGLKYACHRVIKEVAKLLFAALKGIHCFLGFRDVCHDAHGAHGFALFVVQGTAVDFQPDDSAVFFVSANCVFIGQSPGTLAVLILDDLLIFGDDEAFVSNFAHHFFRGYIKELAASGVNVFDDIVVIHHYHRFLHGV